MAHHHHHHVDPESGDRRVALAVIVNLALTVAQIIGGIFAGSLALIADALHNLSDAVSLIIAFFARKIARRPENADMTFGYARVEIVAALINYTTLIVVGFYLAFEAVMRFFEPTQVNGWLIVIIAGIALVIDLVTALLTYSLSKNSVNIRAAFLHNLADAMGSVAVIVAGTLILLFNWWIIDPIVTLMIAAYILWMAFKEIGEVIRILMLASPDGVEADEVVNAVLAVDGVSNVHNARFWRLDEHANAFDAHIALDPGTWSQADGIKAAIKAVLAEKFGIERSTLELECAEHVCHDAHEFGFEPNH